MGKHWDLDITLESSPHFVAVCSLPTDLKNTLVSSCFSVASCSMH